MKSQKQKKNQAGERLFIRMPHNEKEGIVNAAKSNEITISKYVRLLAKHKTPIPKEVKTKVLELILTTTNVLPPIGNNINQLARAMNAIRKQYGEMYLQEHAPEILQLIALPDSWKSVIDEIFINFEYIKKEIASR
jgi:phosphatidate phosphatase PAH1